MNVQRMLVHYFQHVFQIITENIEGLAARQHSRVRP